MHGDFGYAEEDHLGKPYDVQLMRRLVPFVRPYRLLLVLSVLMIVVITLLELSIPYITKIAIDSYIVKKGVHHETAQNEASDQKRYIRVDIQNPRIQNIVSHYPNLFIERDSGTEIAFNDLSKLKKEELKILRMDDLDGVLRITGIFLIVLLFDFLFNFFQLMTLEYVGQRIMHDLRLRLFNHIQSLSLSFFNRNPVGRLVTRVTNDVENMHDMVTSVIVFFFKDLFLLVGITGILIATHVRLTLICFTVIPFVLYVSLYFSNQARNAFREMRIKIAEINSRFSETIGGIQIIQLFLQEKNNYDRFAKLNHEHYLAGMTQLHVFAIFMPLIELLGTIAIAIIIYYGGKGVIGNTISLGEWVAFISYMKMFFQPIRDIAEKYNVMQNAMASAERIFMILDNTEKLPSPPDRHLPRLDSIREISFQNLNFGYIQNEIVLKNISLQIPVGQTVAFVGPTGSGKTSLVNLLIRFYDPTAGNVLINGIPIQSYPVYDLRSKMALVTQDPFIFSGTIKENIFQSERITDEEASEVLNSSNCKSFVERLPAGIDTMLSEGGSSLSSGERQLISIARAFARNPELILMDEATSYIDSETEAKIQGALENLMKNRTSVIVAHRLSTARNADIIFVLYRGKIIESGNHEELMRHRGFYYRLNMI